MQINSTCFLAWNFAFFQVRIATIQKIVGRLHLLCCSATLLLRIVFLYILHTARKIFYLLMSWSVGSLSWSWSWASLSWSWASMSWSWSWASPFWSWSWHLLSCSHHWILIPDYFQNREETDSGMINAPNLCYGCASKYLLVTWNVLLW